MNSPARYGIHKEYAVLLFFVMLVIVYHVFGYVGHFGYDDLSYARLAAMLNQGFTDPSDNYAFRWPVIFFTALSYRIFGVNDFASSLPSIIIFIASLWVIFVILRKDGLISLIAGLGLATLTHWSIYYSDKIMPDVYNSLAVVLVLYFISRQCFGTQNGNTLRNAFFLSLSLIFGMLSKETIILIFPLMAWLVVTDVLLKRRVKFWIWTVTFSFTLLIIYFLVLHFVFGSAMIRFKALMANGYINICSYDSQTTEILLRRIGYDFLNMLTGQGMMAPLIFALGGIFTSRIRNLITFHDRDSFFLLSTILLLLSSNFMTVSFTSYNPLCIDPRHYLFLIPAASLAAAPVIRNFVLSKKNAWSILILLLIVSVHALLIPGDTGPDLYLPLLVCCVAVMFVRRGSPYMAIVFLVLFIAVLAIKPWRMIDYASKVKYPIQREAVYAYLIRPGQPCLVITDDVQKRLGEYYNGFNPDAPCRFIGFDEYKLSGEPDPTVKRYMIVNGYTMYLSFLQHDQLPFYARTPDAGNPVIYRNESIDFTLYELKKSEIPYEIFSSLNDFENTPPFWEEDRGSITGEQKVSGSMSHIPGEFSSTFRIPLDSLDVSPPGKIIVTASVSCLFSQPTMAKLIISFESDKQAYVWEGIDAVKFVRAYNHWCGVNFEYPIDAAAIRKNSVLKVYLWNEGKENFYVDDFRILIQRTH